MKLSLLKGKSQGGGRFATRTRVATPTSSPSTSPSTPTVPSDAPQKPSSRYTVDLEPGTFNKKAPIIKQDPMVLMNTKSKEAITLKDMLSGGGQSGFNRRPRFFSPLLDPSGQLNSDHVPRSTLPLMIYLPGIDGLGLAASRQFARLQQAFDLRSMSIPPENREDFASLVQCVQDYVELELRDADPLRPVYLLGESFGGILALQVALNLGPEKVHRVILVNPATSYVNAPWRTLGPVLTSLPPELYKNLPYALSPILSNPLGLAAFAFQKQLADARAKSPFPDLPVPLPFPPPPPPSPADVAAGVNSFAQGLLQLLPSLGALSDILPPDTLAHKLELLAQGCAAVNPHLGNVQQRTLALFSQLDLLIPSLQESDRYKRAFPRAKVKVFPGRGHALLQEGGVDLVQILSDAGFYQRRRVLSAPLDFQPTVSGRKGRAAGLKGAAQGLEETTKAQTQTEGAMAAQLEGQVAPPAAAVAAATTAVAMPQLTAAAASPATAVPGRTDAASSISSFKVRPADLPTRRELQLQMEESQIELFRRLVSPVFFSTSPEGRIERGLGQVPTDRRPVLLIGNHQTWAPDLGLIITEFLEEKGVLPRGLAHPAIFSDFRGREGQDSGREAKGEGRTGGTLPTALNALFFALLTSTGAQQRDANGANSLGGLFSQFGAVPVSPKNFYRLLQNGEVILLFPGGVREAYKRKGEKYQLFWPSNAEFVRMAARFGATIVPFAAVGAEDAAEILVDSEQLKSLPFLGDRVRQSSSAMPRARRGASADNYNEFGDEAEDFIAPLIAPNGAPDRFYFLFGRPVTLTGSETKEECNMVYGRVREEVEEGLEWLQSRRERDRFRRFEARVLYEAPSQFKRQAPTFELD